MSTILFIISISMLNGGVITSVNTQEFNSSKACLVAAVDINQHFSRSLTAYCVSK